MQQHYMRGGNGNGYMGASLHDLNTVDARHGDMEGISDIDREAITEDSLDNGDESNSVDCMHGSYRNSLTLDDNSRPSSPSYNLLTSQDVIPIEAARARFLDLIIDHFINQHVLEVSEPYHTEDYADQIHGKSSKRKPRENRYEGDPRLALPLMYIANLYENLVNDVNTLLANLNGMIRERTIGVALEAAGGLYRKLVNKFPKKGNISFRRRELATSQATRARFPELVVKEEKRIRFVVINGLVIVEKPTTMSMQDAEWFKRLTGRAEVAISARDYKYYSPRHKYRRSPSQPLFNIHESAAFSGSDSSPLVVTPSEYPQNNEPQNEHHEPETKPHDQQQEVPAQQPHFSVPAQQVHFQRTNHLHPQTGLQNVPQFNPYIHPCTLVATSHMPPPDSIVPHQHLITNVNSINNNNNNGVMPHLACLQSISNAHLSGRVHVLPTSPAKYCDECGSPYLRETSKFCSECGTKRLGI